MWAAGIPIIGKLVEKALIIANNRWGYNKTEQEIKMVAQEVVADSNVMEMIKGFWNFLIEYEGRPELFVQLGVVGKILAILRMGWRPVLQWGMTIDVLRDLLFRDVPIMELKEEIIFIGSLAVLREVGKKFKSRG